MRHLLHRPSWLILCKTNHLVEQDHEFQQLLGCQNPVNLLHQTKKRPLPPNNHCTQVIIDPSLDMSKVNDLL